jgi:dTMP kinase
MGETYIRNLHSLLLGDFAPHLTLIFDIDPLEGLKRAKSRQDTETRFEDLDIEFHHKVRAGFLAIAGRAPVRGAVLNAALDKETLHKQVLQTLRERLNISL